MEWRYLTQALPPVLPASARGPRSPRAERAAAVDSKRAFHAVRVEPLRAGEARGGAPFAYFTPERREERRNDPFIQCSYLAGEHRVAPSSLPGLRAMDALDEGTAEAIAGAKAGDDDSGGGGGGKRDGEKAHLDAVIERRVSERRDKALREAATTAAAPAFLRRASLRWNMGSGAEGTLVQSSSPRASISRDRPPSRFSWTSSAPGSRSVTPRHDAEEDDEEEDETEQGEGLEIADDTGFCGSGPLRASGAGMMSVAFFGKVEVWDAQSAMRRVCELAQHGGAAITAMAWSSARVLCTADERGSVCLWRVLPDEPPPSLPLLHLVNTAGNVPDLAEAVPVTAATFVPGTHLLVVGDAGGEVRVWDVAGAAARRDGGGARPGDARLLRRWTAHRAAADSTDGHGGAVARLGWAGGELLTAGDDGRERRWPLTAEERRHHRARGAAGGRKTVQFFVTDPQC